MYPTTRDIKVGFQIYLAKAQIFFKKRFPVAKEELGTKRVCPETGKRFYDLGKDPIVSPYTGKEYPLTFFEGEPEPANPKEESKEVEAAEAAAAPEMDDAAAEDAPEIISLEDAEEDDDEDTVDGEDIPDIPDVDIDVDDDDAESDDTFLEEDDEDDDLSDVIGGPVASDEDEV